MDIFKSSKLKNTDLVLESLVENDVKRLRVEISRDALRMVRFKNDVYQRYMYLTSLSEMDNGVKPISRYVYYNLNTTQEVLDDVRIRVGEESLDAQRAMREKFIVGLLSIYYLISKGKIYNVPINPLNFILEKNKSVKAFYREDHELGEITDDWLMDFKKLLAYYLVYDTSIIPEKFNEYSIQDYVEFMSNGTQQGFKKFYNCVSIDEMLPLYLKEDEIKALTYTMPLNSDFNEPIDLSSGIPLDLDTAVVNGTHISIEDKEALKQRLLDENKLDKSKVKRADKKQKQRDKIAKKRQKQEERKQRKLDSGYEPNEAKRKANEYNKGYKGSKISLFPLLVLLLVIFLIVTIGYYKITGESLFKLNVIVPWYLFDSNSLENVAIPEPTGLSDFMYRLLTSVIS